MKKAKKYFLLFFLATASVILTDNAMAALCASGEPTCVNDCNGTIVSASGMSCVANCCNSTGSSDSCAWITTSLAATSYSVGPTSEDTSVTGVTATGTITNLEGCCATGGGGCENEE